MSDPIRAAYLRGQMDAYGETIEWLKQVYRAQRKHPRAWLSLWSPLVFWLYRERRQLRDAGMMSASECAGLLRLSGDLWKEEDR